jgi:hypothetical protein
LLDALISIANEKSPALKPGFFELSLPYKSKASNKMRVPLLDEPAVAHNLIIVFILLAALRIL